MKPYSSAQVFLEVPVLEIAPDKERKRGRPRIRPNVIATNPEPVKLSALGESISDDAWQRLELRQNSRNKPLLIERRPLAKGGHELRYFFSNMPQHLLTIDLARLYHERYWIEHGYQQLKEELGLDHHEGRSWIGWNRHVLLTFLAYGYLTLMRLHQKKQQNLTAWKRWFQNKSTLGKEYFV